MANLSEKVANDIRNKILDNTYAPGTKLPNEFELANEYSVCRYTIREAIKKLTAVGLVTVKRGIGTYVNETQMVAYFEPAVERLVLSGKNVTEIFDARMAIEVKTAELAALHADANDLTAMQQYLQEMRAAIEADDLKKFNSLDMQFHSLIASASKNVLLCDILGILYDMITYSIEQVPVTEEKIKRSMKGHEVMFSCITNHDSNQAADTMHKHLEFCRDLYCSNV